jgi:hypothetical protein
VEQRPGLGKIRAPEFGEEWAMPEYKVRLSIDDSRDNTIVEIWEGDRLLVRHPFDAASLDEHIRNLADLRAQMKDVVPRQLDPGARLEAELDPVWKATDKNPPEGRLLALRDPGFGWLGFVFTDKEAAAIAKWLTKERRHSG